MAERLTAQLTASTEDMKLEPFDYFSQNIKEELKSDVEMSTTEMNDDYPPAVKKIKQEKEDQTSRQQKLSAKPDVRGNYHLNLFSYLSQLIYIFVAQLNIS